MFTKITGCIQVHTYGAYPEQTLFPSVSDFQEVSAESTPKWVAYYPQPENTVLRLTVFLHPDSQNFTYQLSTSSVYVATAVNLLFE